jgi:hypothetical protein
MTESLAREVRTKAQLHIQALSELISYLGHADAVNAGDSAEWYRTLIRGMADIADEAKTAEVALTAYAVRDEALNVTEVGKAARISRTAVYDRVKSRFPPNG